MGKLLYLFIGIITLILLSGCSWPVLFYATNTLSESCTIRIKFSGKNHVRDKNAIRYSHIVVKKVKRDTNEQLKDTIQFRKINPDVIELVLPPQSTAVIDYSSSISKNIDSIVFINSQRTQSFSSTSYSKLQKVSGGMLSGFAQSCLYTIK